MTNAHPQGYDGIEKDRYEDGVASYAVAIRNEVEWEPDPEVEGFAAKWEEFDLFAGVTAHVDTGEDAGWWSVTVWEMTRTHGWDIAAEASGGAEDLDAAKLAAIKQAAEWAWNEAEYERYMDSILPPEEEEA